MPRLRSILLQVIAVGVVASILLLLDTVPVLVSDDAVRSYRTLEQAEKMLGWRRPMLPAYFPSYIAWPPEEVLAGRDPAPMLVLHFRHRESSELALAIAQVEADDVQVPLRVEPVELVRKAERELHGRRLTMWRGRCEDGALCTKVRWREPPYTLSVGLRDGLDELLRIVGSMLVE